MPSHYAVCIDTSPPKDPSQLLSLLPTRAADVLRDKGLKEPSRLVEAREGAHGGGGPIGQLLLQADDRGGSRGRGASLRPRSGPKIQRRHTGVSAGEGAELCGRTTSIWFEPYFPPRPGHLLRVRMSVGAVTSAALQKGGTMHPRLILLASSLRWSTVTSVASASIDAAKERVAVTSRIAFTSFPPLALSDGPLGTNERSTS